MMRFLEMSVQAFALVGVWRGASAMVANGVATEQLGLLHTIEPFTIPATLLAIIGSAAATHIGFRRWRKLQKVAGADRDHQPRLAEPSLASGGQPDRLIADLQNRVVELSREKELLARLLREKSESMRIDPLTGVFNRLAYEEHLQSEYQRWKRFGNPLAFLIWDIDRFKEINDRYGHAVGDAVLRGVARQLADRIRATDFLARYGGEEFAMLLPGADAKAALKVADKLRLGIAELEFGTDEVKVPVTISCGLSCFEPGDLPESVFGRADHALYRAKDSGRNCCWVS
ncbi:MAG: GGDEF domain-containing protein [Candidatus Competibacteraceae bacterium]|nr:GGDEF domain-containing protein [Candidatus Competibacteraceae bacterium]